MVQLRPLYESDLGAVYRLAQDRLWGPWPIDRIRADFKCPGTIAWGGFLEKTGPMIGFVWGLAVGDEAEIHGLVVDAAHEGRGFGQDLVKVFVKTCWTQAVEKIYLEVAVTNTAAKKLYTRLGFTAGSMRKGYYRREGKPVDGQIFFLCK